MKRILASIGCVGATLLGLAAQELEVRKWTSKQGSASFEGFVVGADEAGNVLLQSYSPRKVPLASLSEKDQAFVKEWQAKRKKEGTALKAARDVEVYAPPMMAPLKGTLQKLEGKELKPYNPAKPEEIKILAFFFTQGKVDNTRRVSLLSDYYAQTIRDTPCFDVVMFSLDETEAEMKQFMMDNKVKFPVLDFVATKRSAGKVAELFKGSIVPQLVVVTPDGKVLSRSYKDKNSDEGDFTATLKELEKAVREAKREAAKAEAKP